MPTSVFNIPTASTSTSPSPKIHVTFSNISSKYIDPRQPPTKAVPFQQINGLQFAKDLRICMPVRAWKKLYLDTYNEVVEGDEDVDISSPEITEVSQSISMPRLRYTRVTMTLKEILDNEDLRRGEYVFHSAPNLPLLRQSTNSKAKSTTSTSSTISNPADTTITLSRGTLTILLPHHLHQRSGLTFPTTKHRTGSQKHDDRAMMYRVEMDLRSPSMVRGKKGFDRLMYAAKNVEGFKELREWIVYEVDDVEWRVTGRGGGKKRKRGGNEIVGGTDKGDPNETVQSHPDQERNHPLSNCAPAELTADGTKTAFEDVLIPSFLSDPIFFSTLHSSVSTHNTQRANLPTILEEDIYDVVEYLSLLFHRSPRITKSGYGKIDPYLCQYVLPDLSVSSSGANVPAAVHGATSQSAPMEGKEEEMEEAQSDDLINITYTGFIPSTFITTILVDLLRRSRVNHKRTTDSDVDRGDIPWAAVNIVAHPSPITGTPDGLMILLQSGSNVKDENIESEQRHVYSRGNKSSGDMQVGEGQIHNRQGNNEVKDSSPPLMLASSRGPALGFRHVTCFEIVDTLTR